MENQPYVPVHFRNDNKKSPPAAAPASSQAVGAAPVPFVPSTPYNPTAAAPSPAPSPAIFVPPPATAPQQAPIAATQAAGAPYVQNTQPYSGNPTHYVYGTPVRTPQEAVPYVPQAQPYSGTPVQVVGVMPTAPPAPTQYPAPSMYKAPVPAPQASSPVPAPVVAAAPDSLVDDGFVSGFNKSSNSFDATNNSTKSSSTAVQPPTPVKTQHQPTTYHIKEKFWGFGDNFTITDQNGTAAFQVRGRAFSWGDKLSFQDMSGGELAFISQQNFSFKPYYQIFKDGKVFAEVVKEWTWFKQEFTLDVPGPNDYTIKGSFWQHDFTFERRGRTVATVSKKLFGMTDSYGVEIAGGEDVVAILCACIVIDQVLHDDDR